MTHALIVIDMQQGSFGDATPRHDAAGLVGRLNQLAAAVRTAGGAVVFIQHDGPPGDPHHPDRPGWRLLESLEVHPADTIIRKKSCDAFLDTSLDAFLACRSIDRLIVTGCATDYCVDTTGAQRAGARHPDHRPVRRPHHLGQAASAGRKDHRAPQRHLGGLHRARRAGPDLPVLRPAPGLKQRRLSTRSPPLQAPRRRA